MEYSKNSMSVEDIDTLFINTYCNNCNDAVFLEMYEPEAVILATCWPSGEMTRGQWIIKMLPIDSTGSTGVIKRTVAV